MREFYARHREAVDKAAFFIFIIVAVYIFFNFLLVYTAPFFSGMLIALVMEPLIRMLGKKARIVRKFAAPICLLLFLAAMGSLGTLIVSSVSRQVSSFMENAPAFIDEVSRTLDRLNKYIAGLADLMPESIRFESVDVQGELTAILTSVFGGGVWNQSVRFVSGAPEFFISVILSLVTAFFLMKDGPAIIGNAKKICPRWLERNLRMMKRGLSRAVGGYFRAQFIMMSIVFALGVAGLFILGNPYALLIGLIMAVLDFLPMVGSGSVLIPWAAFSFATGRTQLGTGLIILYGVITVVRQISEPKILGVQVGVHPLAMLMSMFIGYKVFGFLGIFIGPSLVIIGKAINDAERGGEIPAAKEHSVRKNKFFSAVADRFRRRKGE